MQNAQLKPEVQLFIRKVVLAALKTEETDRREQTRALARADDDGFAFSEKISGISFADTLR